MSRDHAGRRAGRGQVLRRYASAGDLDPTRAEEALEDLSDLPIVRYPHQPFAERIWQLRENLTAYDAAYVALAEALDAPLLTRDSGIAGSPAHAARIDLI